jgi:ankyrin repeat protein
MGENVDYEDDQADTPLIAAIVSRSILIVKLLVGAGAKLNHCNRFGSSPLGYAKHYGYLEIVNYLEERGAFLLPTERH